MRKGRLFDNVAIIFGFAGIGFVLASLVAILGRSALASLIVMAIMLVGGIIAVAYTSEPECNCECRCVLEEGDDDP